MTIWNRANANAFRRALWLAVTLSTPWMIACASASEATPAAASAPQATVHAQAPAYPTMAPVGEYLMNRDAEIALARSAAPPPIAAKASVLVLTRAGYEKAIEGSNGFVCLVERAWTSPFDDAEFWNPKTVAPMCLNAPAARSALPVNIKRTELALAGLTKEQSLAKLKDLIAQKTFAAPEIGSMSYMLSKQTWSDAHEHWHPHLMFYMPGSMGAPVWGANLAGLSPVYGGGGDLPGGGQLPWTLFLVPVPRWSDGSLDEHLHASP